MEKARLDIVVFRFALAAALWPTSRALALSPLTCQAPGSISCVACHAATQSRLV